MKMMKKASVTVFCSLSLSSFILLIIVLATLCIRNEERLRIEGLTDIGLNSVLGEYCLALKEEYDLLYVDATYLNASASVENLKNHIRYYLEKNTNDGVKEQIAPWGMVSFNNLDVTDFQTATAEYGNSMKEQASEYVRRRSGLEKLREEVSSVTEVFPEIEDDPFEMWDGLMETISGMPLPEVEDPETGELRTIQLSNPSEGVHSLRSSDIMYSVGVETSGLSSAGIDLNTLCSVKGIENVSSISIRNEGTEEEFLAYLINKMGCFHYPKENHLFRNELEYIIEGANSDYENLRGIIRRIYNCRAADNLSFALSDGQLLEEAVGISEGLEVCTYAPEFIEPIAMSIVCAAAYLETISDVECIMKGGKIPFKKSEYGMSIAAVLNTTRYLHFSYEGMSYRQYLIGMLRNMDHEIRNLRTMDLMEMEIRRVTGNSFFSMDWCVERFRVSVEARGSLIERKVERLYGYF